MVKVVAGGEVSPDQTSPISNPSNIISMLNTMSRDSSKTHSRLVVLLTSSPLRTKASPLKVILRKGGNTPNITPLHKKGLLYYPKGCNLITKAQSLAWLMGDPRGVRCRGGVDR